MNFPKANTFPKSIMRERSMGPNPLKLCEELLGLASIPAGSVVLDLGSGAGLTSALMARECGLVAYAADLWSDPSDNMRFFEECGLNSRQVVPLKADATALPFAHGLFDAVVSVDSYNYFGRDPEYLGEHLLPLVKCGGELLFAIPGVVRDCHDDLPACLLASWTPEQLDYMHDMSWWRANLSQTEGIDWLGLVPVAVCLGFGVLGVVQMVGRRSLLKVDPDLLLLGVHYIVVAAAYLAFEMFPVNYRPIPIDGAMVAFYPSSTTLLVLGVMPTLAYQVARRAKSGKAKAAVTTSVVAFSALMVVGRLVSGVHWATDIAGSVLLAAGLFAMYRYVVAQVDARLTPIRLEGCPWSSARNSGS